MSTSIFTNKDKTAKLVIPLTTFPNRTFNYWIFLEGEGIYQKNLSQTVRRRYLQYRHNFYRFYGLRVPEAGPMSIGWMKLESHQQWLDSLKDQCYWDNAESIKSQREKRERDQFRAHQKKIKEKKKIQRDRKLNEKYEAQFSACSFCNDLVFQTYHGLCVDCDNLRLRGEIVPTVKKAKNFNRVAYCDNINKDVTSTPFTKKYNKRRGCYTYENRVASRSEIDLEIHRNMPGFTNVFCPTIRVNGEAPRNVNVPLKTPVSKNFNKKDDTNVCNQNCFYDNRGVFRHVNACPNKVHDDGHVNGNEMTREELNKHANKINSQKNFEKRNNEHWLARESFLRSELQNQGKCYNELITQLGEIGRSKFWGFNQNCEVIYVAYNGYNRSEIGHCSISPFKNENVRFCYKAISIEKFANLVLKGHVFDGDANLAATFSKDHHNNEVKTYDGCYFYYKLEQYIKNGGNYYINRNLEDVKDQCNINTSLVYETNGPRPIEDHELAHALKYHSNTCKFYHDCITLSVFKPKCIKCGADLGLWSEDTLASYFNGCCNYTERLNKDGKIIEWVALCKTVDKVEYESLIYENWKIRNEKVEMIRAEEVDRLNEVVSRFPTIDPDLEYVDSGVLLQGKMHSVRCHFNPGNSQTIEQLVSENLVPVDNLSYSFKAPCGSGKTKFAIFPIMARLNKEKGVIVLLTERVSAVVETFNFYTSASNREYSNRNHVNNVIMLSEGKATMTPGATFSNVDMVIGTFGTAINFMDQLEPILHNPLNQLFIDECHNVNINFIVGATRIFLRVGRVSKVFMTATPLAEQSYNLKTPYPSELYFINNGQGRSLEQIRAHGRTADWLWESVLPYLRLRKNIDNVLIMVPGHNLCLEIADRLKRNIEQKKIIICSRQSNFNLEDVKRRTNTEQGLYIVATDTLQEAVTLNLNVLFDLGCRYRPGNDFQSILDVDENATWYDINKTLFPERLEPLTVQEVVQIFGRVGRNHHNTVDRAYILITDALFNESPGLDFHQDNFEFVGKYDDLLDRSRKHEYDAMVDKLERIVNRFQIYNTDHIYRLQVNLNKLKGYPKPGIFNMSEFIKTPDHSLESNLIDITNRDFKSRRVISNTFIRPLRLQRIGARFEDPLNHTNKLRPLSDNIDLSNYDINLKSSRGDAKLYIKGEKDVVVYLKNSFQNNDRTYVTNIDFSKPFLDVDIPAIVYNEQLVVRTFKKTKKGPVQNVTYVAYQVDRDGYAHIYPNVYQAYRWVQLNGKQLFNKSKETFYFWDSPDSKRLMGNSVGLDKFFLKKFGQRCEQCLAPINHCTCYNEMSSINLSTYQSEMILASGGSREHIEEVLSHWQPEMAKRIGGYGFDKLLTETLKCVNSTTVSKNHFYAYIVVPLYFLHRKYLGVESYCFNKFFDELIRKLFTAENIPCLLTHFLREFEIFFFKGNDEIPAHISLTKDEDYMEPILLVDYLNNPTLNDIICYSSPEERDFIREQIAVARKLSVSTIDSGIGSELDPLQLILDRIGEEEIFEVSETDFADDLDSYINDALAILENSEENQAELEDIDLQNRKITQAEAISKNMKPRMSKYKSIDSYLATVGTSAITLEGCHMDFWNESGFDENGASAPGADKIPIYILLNKNGDRYWKYNCISLRPYNLVHPDAVIYKTNITGYEKIIKFGYILRCKLLCKYCNEDVCWHNHVCPQFKANKTSKISNIANKARKYMALNRTADLKKDSSGKTNKLGKKKDSNDGLDGSGSSSNTKGKTYNLPKGTSYTVNPVTEEIENIIEHDHVPACATHWNDLNQKHDQTRKDVKEYNKKISKEFEDLSSEISETDSMGIGVHQTAFDHRNDPFEGAEIIRDNSVSVTSENLEEENSNIDYDSDKDYKQLSRHTYSDNDPILASDKFFEIVNAVSTGYSSFRDPLSGLVYNTSKPYIVPHMGKHFIKIHCQGATGIKKHDAQLMIDVDNYWYEITEIKIERQSTTSNFLLERITTDNVDNSSVLTGTNIGTGGFNLGPTTPNLSSEKALVSIGPGRVHELHTDSFICIENSKENPCYQPQYLEADSCWDHWIVDTCLRCYSVRPKLFEKICEECKIVNFIIESTKSYTKDFISSLKMALQPEVKNLTIEQEVRIPPTETDEFNDVDGTLTSVTFNDDSDLSDDDRAFAWNNVNNLIPVVEEITQIAEKKNFQCVLNVVSVYSKSLHSTVNPILPRIFITKGIHIKNIGQFLPGHISLTYFNGSVPTDIIEVHRLLTNGAVLTAGHSLSTIKSWKEWPDLITWNRTGTLQLPTGRHHKWTIKMWGGTHWFQLFETGVSPNTTSELIDNFLNFIIKKGEDICADLTTLLEEVYRLERINAGLYTKGFIDQNYVIKSALVPLESELKRQQIEREKLKKYFNNSVPSFDQIIADYIKLKEQDVNSTPLSNKNKTFDEESLEKFGAKSTDLMDDGNYLTKQNYNKMWQKYHQFDSMFNDVLEDIDNQLDWESAMTTTRTFHPDDLAFKNSRYTVKMIFDKITKFLLKIEFHNDTSEPFIITSRSFWRNTMIKDLPKFEKFVHYWGALESHPELSCGHDIDPKKPSPFSQEILLHSFNQGQSGGSLTYETLIDKTFTIVACTVCGSMFSFSGQTAAISDNKPILCKNGHIIYNTDHTLSADSVIIRKGSQLSKTVSVNIGKSRDIVHADLLCPLKELFGITNMITDEILTDKNHSLYICPFCALLQDCEHSGPAEGTDAGYCRNCKNPLFVKDHELKPNVIVIKKASNPEGNATDGTKARAWGMTVSTDNVSQYKPVNSFIFPTDHLHGIIPSAGWFINIKFDNKYYKYIWDGLAWSSTYTQAFLDEDKKQMIRSPSNEVNIRGLSRNINIFSELSNLFINKVDYMPEGVLLTGEDFP